MKYTITLTDGICPGVGVVSLTHRGALLALFDRANGNVTAEVELDHKTALDLSRSGYTVEQYATPATPLAGIVETGAEAPSRRRGKRFRNPVTTWTDSTPAGEGE